jgi:hypothetical protein
MVSRSAGPHYDLKVVIKSCSKIGAVRFTKAAREDAKKHFRFNTEAQLIAFIANFGLVDLKFDNSNPLEKGPEQDIGKPVDGYTFKIGNQYGYIAFYYNFKDIWIIKSFHKPEVGECASTLMHNPFAILGEQRK